MNIENTEIQYMKQNLNESKYWDNEEFINSAPIDSVKRAYKENEEQINGYWDKDERYDLIGEDYGSIE